MKTITTEILVIGGGATGAGVVQDVALRGFRAVLVEKRDLTHGTTGRYHGLLHSGGRYVVKDPKAATECIEENGILRRIMPHCLEDTGGFFVTTPWDDPAYADEFAANCAKAGVPCEEIPLTVMRREEPRLHPDISRCFRVPDAAADSFLATQCVAESARLHGAEILTYHEVRRLLREGDKVVGAVCWDLVKDEEVVITADITINAAGAWAGKIAGSIGVEVNVLAGKGTMIAANHRMVNTVINRCKMPDDGDILVPIQTVAVIGTTDERVADPEHFAIEPWEIDLMMEEGEKLVPAFSRQRFSRWLRKRPKPPNTKSPIVFFHGCSTEYYEARVGKAAVQVLEANGFEVIAPKQNCCGLTLLHDEGELKTDDLLPIPLQLPYHAPCQYKAHRLGIPSLEIMALIPELEIIESTAVCCGVAGTYGYKAEKYQIAMDVGRPLFDFVAEMGGPLVVCDSETCRWQISAATGKPAIHPIELLAAAYGCSVERPLAQWIP